MTGLILRHTTSLGVRIADYRRSVLERSQSLVETAYGPVPVSYTHLTLPTSDLV